MKGNWTWTAALSCTAGAVASGLPQPAWAHGEPAIAVLRCWHVSERPEGPAGIECLAAETDGHPLPGARIELHAGQGGPLQWRADGQGRIRLRRPHGDFHLLLRDGRGNTQEVLARDVAASSQGRP